MVGIISTLVSLIIGITFGATAGYLGGKIDELMMPSSMCSTRFRT